MKFVLKPRHIAVIALLFGITKIATASLGDRLPEFQECVEVTCNRSTQYYISLTAAGL